MMEPIELYKLFKAHGVTFFTGVPDSTFKGWTQFLEKGDEYGFTNIIASNECEAIAIASGYHLGTAEVPLAYMQNSGLGKCVNPITSLASNEVYSIPMLLMIGWRGRPGQQDEPQHIKMGKTTLPLLDLLGIPFAELPDSISEADKVLKEACDYVSENKSQFALIVNKGAISEYASERKSSSVMLSREETIKIIVSCLGKDDVVLSTTGKTSRELYEYRKSAGESPRDFYTVGSMGCVAAIGLGASLKNCGKRFYIFDGDGSLLMQMGSLATIGHYKPGNLFHIVFDNNSYDSTGGQPTVSEGVDLVKLALASGYKEAVKLEDPEGLKKYFASISSLSGPVMIVIPVRKGARKDLGRPETSPVENKELFMQNFNNLMDLRREQ